MNITIIGASDMFARSFADWAIEAGHTITFVGFSTAQAKEMVEKIGSGKPVGPEATIIDDLVFLAIPYMCLQPVLQTYPRQIGDKVVVDLITPIDLNTLELVHPVAGSASHEILGTWPKTKVVKAISSKFSPMFLKQSSSKEMDEIFLASDNKKAKDMIAAFFQEGGLRPIDAGLLDQAKELEKLGYQDTVLGQTSPYN